MEKRLSKHKEAVKGMTQTMGLLYMHGRHSTRYIDWEAVTVKLVETYYTRRRTVEAIHIGKEEVTSNLDCGRHLSPIWGNSSFAHPKVTTIPNS